MIADEFNKIRESGRDPTLAEREDYNETLRDWHTYCPRCGYAKVGTLQEIRKFFSRCTGHCTHGPQ